LFRFTDYKFEAGLFPTNPSFEQTHCFLVSCAAATIAAVIYSKGAPYRKPLYTNKIIFAWTVAAVVTTIFMSLYASQVNLNVVNKCLRLHLQDYAERLNMLISPSFSFRLIIVAVMVFDGLFCYMWETYFLDGFLFAKVLPWYKAHIRGPSLPFEHLEEELRSREAWPPVEGASTLSIANRNNERGTFQ